MRRNRRHAGFTMVEMLVVLAIILIVATTSLMAVGGFLKGQSVKEGGLILRAAVTKARQVAATKRRLHFLVFDMANSVMTIYEDTDGGKSFSNSMSGGGVSGGDLMTGEAISLPQNAHFDKVFGQTSGAPYAAFQPDGSVLFYSNVGSATTVSDQSWTGSGFSEGGAYSSSLMTKTDIIVRLGPDTTNAPDKVFCDILGIAGIVRKIEYFHKDGETLTAW